MLNTEFVEHKSKIKCKLNKIIQNNNINIVANDGI